VDLFLNSRPVRGWESGTTKEQRGSAEQGSFLIGHTHLSTRVFETPDTSFAPKKALPQRCAVEIRSTGELLYEPTAKSHHLIDLAILNFVGCILSDHLKTI
jgi:hypothetical protein